MPMVKWWKKSESVQAKVTTLPDGSLGMYMQGEDYAQPGFPRSHMLFGNYRGTGYGPLSVLKHTIKNEIFNYAWYALEKGTAKEDVIRHIKDVSLPKVYEIAEDLKYDILPVEKMSAGVREIWRAMEVLEKRHPLNRHLKGIKKVFGLVFLDDDSYFFRVKWIVQIFNPSSLINKLLFSNPIKDFDLALQELEVAEVMGDMKERIRLLRAGLNLLLADESIRKLFKELCNEVDWNKVKINKQDMYFLRAKYFKADLIRFEY